MLNIGILHKNFNNFPHQVGFMNLDFSKNESKPVNFQSIVWTPVKISHIYAMCHKLVTIIIFYSSIFDFSGCFIIIYTSISDFCQCSHKKVLVLPFGLSHITLCYVELYCFHDFHWNHCLSQFSDILFSILQGVLLHPDGEVRPPGGQRGRSARWRSACERGLRNLPRAQPPLQPKQSYWGMRTTGAILFLDVYLCP